MIKALKIVLVTLVCFVLIIGIGGYVALTQVDFNNYKTLIVKMVKESTGRDLSIGDIKVGVSLMPVVEISDVTLSNAKWAKNPYMFKAKSVDVSVAVLPLFNKEFVINNFKISEAQVNLEDSDNGVNWEFKETEKVEPKNALRFEIIKSANAKEVVVEGNSGIFSSLDIKKVLIDNVNVDYTKSGKSSVYKVNTLELVKRSNKEIVFRVNVNDGMYKGGGSIGTFNLLEDKKGYPIVAELDVMGIGVEVSLKVFDAFGDIRFEGGAKLVDFLGKNSGFNERLIVAYKGNLREIVTNIRELSVADNVVEGKVDLNLGTEVPMISASLNSPKINISSFSKKEKVAIFDVIVKEAKATELAPNIVIPYKDLYLVNANVELDVNKIVNDKGVIVKDFKGNVTLNKGVMNFNIVNANTFNGKVLGNIGLNAKNSQLDVDLEAQKFNLFDMIKLFSSKNESLSFIDGGVADVYVKLKSVGNTYAELVENLDGNSVVIVDKSKLYMGNIGKLKGDILSQLLNSLNISKGNDELNMSCAVVRADFGDKKVKFPNGIVVNADKFTVVADGNINLKNDKLSISIKPFAGKLTETNIAKVLSSLIKLSGTIHKPKVSVDSANAIKTILGVTTAGPVYLGAQMLLESDGSPCYSALEGTGYETRFPKPKNVVSTTGEDVGKILNDSVGSVKDATKDILNLLSGGLKKNKENN